MVHKPAYKVRPLMAGETDLLDQVVCLGDLHKRWLGLMTRVAFAEYASRDKVLIAVDGNTVLGYALFDLPRQRVRLAHLCVDEAARKQGVARALVNELSRLHSERQGIVLRCRRDWPANKYWPYLGFTVLSNSAGRSKDGHLLTSWWRDHGIPDLFSTANAENPRVVVALDTNVFRDLHEPGRGPEAEQSEVLQADWVDDEIELVLTGRTKIELNDNPDPKLRERLLNTANSLYRTLVGRPQPGEEDLADLLEKQIVAAIAQEELRRDPSLYVDARILAEADAGEADVFVSRDENAVAILAAAAEPFTDVWVSTPTGLIVHLDEIRDAANYSPARLFNSDYSIAEADSRSENDLALLHNTALGERLGEFRGLIRSSAQYVRQSGSRLVLRDPGRAVVAAAFTHTDGDTLNVSVLRAANTKLAKTIAVQLLHVIRKRACEVNARHILITDPYPSAIVTAAMLDMGYELTDAGFVAHLLQGCMPWDEVTVELPALQLSWPNLSDLTPSSAGELERILWPLKVSDAPLPCYLVPIKPDLAAALLNNEPALWQTPELGLSRQHVYYRSPRNAGLDAPARILWYVSGKVGAVVAASRLEQIVVAHPGTLYRKFRRLGVLERSVIDTVARRGRAMALVYADTEFFNTPIPLKRLEEIDRRLKPLASPRRVPTTSFFSVYREGRAP